MNFSAHHKPLMGGVRGNYVKIVGWNNIDFCQITKFFEDPNIKPILALVNATVSGMIGCPFGPGYIKIVNASILSDTNAEISTTQRYPNGYYKAIWTLFNHEDDNILSGVAISESKHRNNVLDSNDKF